ncbi:15159_t:CDS:2, partial [Racocetra fulgida]
ETFDLTVNEEHSPDDNTLENISDNTSSDHQLRDLAPSNVIYCGKTFETWEECQEALDNYARNNNFIIRKKRKIGCPFLVNASKSKSSNGETAIKLTLVNLIHNHQLVPKNANFATKYRKLTVEMKDLIESYTLCNLDISSQIRHFMEYVDAAKLLQHLEIERVKNSDWYVQPLIDTETNRLQVQTAAKAIGRKQSIKRTLLGLAHKYVETVNYNDLNDYNHLIKIFKEQIQIHEERNQPHTIIMYNRAAEYNQVDKQNIEQDHIMEDDEVSEYDQIMEDDYDSKIMRDEYDKRNCPTKQSV